MKPRPALPALVTGVCGLLALVLLATPPRRAPRGPHQEPLLPRQDILRVVGRGYIQLVADYFWLQLIQITGSALKAEDYRDIFPYADLVTDLDPRFRMVYGFAAGALPTNLGREQWVNTQESTRLLHKGLKVFPDDLKMNMLLAYNLSSFHHQYREAAEVLRHAATLPGAPSYLSALATRLYAQSGDVRAGRLLAESLVETAEDEETREIFKQRLRDLDLEEQLQRVDKAIANFRTVFGAPPPDVATLLWWDYLSEPPVDPQGGGFFIGEDGRARSETQRRRLEVYTPENR